MTKRRLSAPFFDLHNLTSYSQHNWHLNIRFIIKNICNAAINN